VQEIIVDSVRTSLVGDGSVPSPAPPSQNGQTPGRFMSITTTIKGKTNGKSTTELNTRYKSIDTVS